MKHLAVLAAWLVALTVVLAPSCGGGGSSDDGGGGAGGGGDNDAPMEGGMAACDGKAKFVPVLEGMEWAALASGWAAGGIDDAIVLVGGRSHVPATIHWTGKEWTHREVSLKRVSFPELLWWVHGFSATQVFAVGEEGTALYYGDDRPDDDQIAWRQIPTGSDATLSGVWGAAPDDVWAVGGYPGSSREQGEILHWGGVTWLATRYSLTDSADDDIIGDCTEKTASKLSSRQLVTKSNLFKVWGSMSQDGSGARVFDPSKDRLFAVGTRGTILSGDNSKWFCGHVEREIDFTTVWGRSGSDAFAVGRRTIPSPDPDIPPRTEGALYHFDGNAWTAVALPEGTPELLGVGGDDKRLFVVGYQGTALQGGPMGEGWQRLGTGTSDAIHQVFTAGNEVIAVGGNLQDPAIERHGFALALCPTQFAMTRPANLDGGLDAREPPPKGKGETEASGKCVDDSDCVSGLECIWVYGGPICTKVCNMDPDCYNNGYGSNPCCTRSSRADGVLACAPADHCPPDW